MKKILTMVLMMGLIMAPQMAEAYWLDIGAGYWSPTPTGGITVGGLGGDLENDLGMDSEGFMQIRAKADLPGINVGLMTTPVEFTGTGTVDFGAGSMSGDTLLTMEQTDVTLFWAVPFLDMTGLLNVEFGLNAKLVNFEVGVDTGVASAGQDFSATIPMLYLGAQIKPTDSFHIEAEYRGISVDDNEFTDIMAKLKWNVVPFFNVSAGYRTQTIKLDDSTVKSDIEFKGPFAELGFQF